MNIDIENPEDGMVTEVFPGVFYEYRARENSWIRINGYESIKPATQIDAGLMTKEDFIKVDELLTSPPKTTLTSEDCNIVFDGGVIDFYSKDNSVFVEDYLDLYENGQTTREPWHIHEDTWGFNFRVNLQYLVEEMKERGNIISETVVGPKGPDGDRGEPGINKLDTGPRGEQGPDGSNAPFEGTLINNSALTVKDKTRAVVDVDVEKISPDENYLVVYKGVISPENFCTTQASVQNIQSSWVLARGQGGIVCGSDCATAPCETVFVDIDVITNSIREHFNNMILRLKSDKEAQVREWTRTMMQVFNDQKYALCCGLENCKSRQRNQDERRYIESQRIAAAAADFNLVISGRYTGGDAEDVDTDKYKNCDGPGWQPTEVVAVNPGGGYDKDTLNYSLNFGAVESLKVFPQELTISKNEYPTITLKADGEVKEFVVPEVTKMGGYVWNNKDGTVIYYPAWDWVGTDSFDFVANDGQNSSAPATITINVV